MASPGPEVFAPVLAALATMQANVERAQKSQAHEYLESFQKSASTHVTGKMVALRGLTGLNIQPEAWTITHSILSSTQTTAEAKLFAATTLKGKVSHSAPVDGRSASH